jgi:hypothetical protein
MRLDPQHGGGGGAGLRLSHGSGGERWRKRVEGQLRFGKNR